MEGHFCMVGGLSEQSCYAAVAAHASEFASLREYFLLHAFCAALGLLPGWCAGTLNCTGGCTDASMDWLRASEHLSAIFPCCDRLLSAPAVWG